MLLLYPKNAFVRFGTVTIYIPLCFYFIWITGKEADWEAYLHSTMLLLYPLRSADLLEPGLHLHSTMLLLYRAWNHGWDNDIFIYIPLCFYFIATPGHIPDIKTIHLHSTMLLLYQSRKTLGMNLKNRFTFHYASTLSNQVRHLRCIILAFTFHYASTLS